MRVAQLLLSSLLCVALFGQAKLESDELQSNVGQASPIPQDGDASREASVEAQKLEYIVGLYEKEASDPVPKGREIKMVSSTGQEFSCVLPTGEAEEEEAEEDLKTMVKRKLLTAFKDQCLVSKNSGYWSYEVCLYKGVTQFHGEQSEDQRVSFSLGNYRKDLDDYPQLDEEDAERPSESAESRKIREALAVETPESVIYAQRYAGGTSGRRTLVQFVCVQQRSRFDGAPGTVIEVKEPREFHYTITVASPHACVSEYSSKSKVPVPKLLTPLKQQCIYMNQGWWNYEFCYNEHVRQFHMETVNTAVSDKETKTKKTTSQTVTTVDFFLGRKTSNSTIRIHKGETPSTSYASQEYYDGTTCDLTNLPRKVEVRYVCDADTTKSRIMSIQETSTCEYILVIATPLICVNETFQPVQPKLLQISCHPSMGSLEKGDKGADDDDDQD
uniref:MRH domain-containing protein n=1 Tax=Lotharella globosa TaxID=91324 RepID=A0A7S3ZBF1_9EUKA